MTDGAISPPWPAYVTPGYHFGFQIVGESAAGFWGNPNQIVLTYVFESDPALPLAIFAGSNSGETALFATEGREGQTLDLGPGTAAVYHDGVWQLGPGIEEQRAGNLTLHWNRDDTHSITVTVADRVFAVRGSRSRRVSFDELVRITRSLPLT